MVSGTGGMEMGEEIPTAGITGEETGAMGAQGVKTRRAHLCLRCCTQGEPRPSHHR